MNRILLLTLLTSFVSCSDIANEKTNQSNKDTTPIDTPKLLYSKSDTSLEPYYYDTILKGGYNILFSTDDSTERLYLKKDNKIIKEIASCSKGLPYKNLGYKAADFVDYFVLAQSFGSENPTYIKLIKKENGLNILKEGSAWIGANEEKGLLLYSETDAPSPKDKMILYSVNTKQKKDFDFPTKVFDEPMILDRIKLDSITDKQLVIEYETQNGLLKKKYNL